MGILISRMGIRSLSLLRKLRANIFFESNWYLQTYFQNKHIWIITNSKIVLHSRLIPLVPMHNRCACETTIPVNNMNMTQIRKGYEPINSLDYGHSICLRPDLGVEWIPTFHVLAIDGDERYEFCATTYFYRHAVNCLLPIINANQTSATSSKFVYGFFYVIFC